MTSKDQEKDRNHVKEQFDHYLWGGALGIWISITYRLWFTFPSIFQGDGFLGRHYELLGYQLSVVLTILFILGSIPTYYFSLRLPYNIPLYGFPASFVVGIWGYSTMFLNTLQTILLTVFGGSITSFLFVKYYKDKNKEETDIEQRSLDDFE